MKRRYLDYVFTKPEHEVANASTATPETIRLKEEEAEFDAEQGWVSSSSSREAEARSLGRG